MRLLCDPHVRHIGREHGNIMQLLHQRMSRMHYELYEVEALDILVEGALVADLGCRMLVRLAVGAYLPL